MNGRDEAIWSFLDRAVPLPSGGGRDWEDTLARSRATRKAVRTRRLGFAVLLVAVLAVVLAVTPLGAMIASGFGDFSGWLSGSSGSPVSTGERQAFESESRRSWVRFPQSAKLRRLIEVTRDGVDYVLYGYRAGDTFCLSLTASGKASSTHATCGPTRALESRSAPVIPLGVNVLIASREKHGHKRVFIPRASVTFGVASDGVVAVRAGTRSGELRAVISGDSFLIVNPNPSDPARSISASDSAGDVAAIPFAREMTISIPPHKLSSPPGPKKVERTVTGVRIGWLARREPRGEPWRVRGRHPFGKIVFIRLLSPDPGGIERVLVSLREVQGKLWVCNGIVLAAPAAGACTDYASLSSPGRPPLLYGEYGGGSGGQYTTISGLASDEVRRMTLFVESGERVSVPLEDNAFIIGTPVTRFPVRLVGYDRENRVIADVVLP